MLLIICFLIYLSDYTKNTSTPTVLRPHTKLTFYRPHSEAREGYVFTGVCHSLCPMWWGGGGWVGVSVCTPVGSAFRGSAFLGGGDSAFLEGGGSAFLGGLLYEEDRPPKKADPPRRQTPKGQISPTRRQRTSEFGLGMHSCLKVDFFTRNICCMPLMQSVYCSLSLEIVSLI